MNQRGNAELGAPTADGQNVDGIHQRLREAILRGELPPGQEMSQVQLANQLGVSRTPLREALRMLQREGLVEAEFNRRVRVAGFSLPDLEQLYCVRLVLEATGIRLTTPRLAPEEIAGLEGAMAQMAHFAAEEDYERWEVPHRAFHAGLVSKSGERSVRLLAQLSDHAERYRRLYTVQGTGAWQRGVVHHRAILDAVKARDGDEAARWLVIHLGKTPLSVIEMVDPSYEAARLREVLVELVGSDDLAPAAP